MRKLVSLALTLAFVASFSFSAGIATAAPAAGHLAARSAAQEIGDTITVTDTDGNDVAKATVDDIIDPFEDMQQSPKKGLRFISVEVTIENTGKDTLTVTPGNIGVVDDKGIIYVGVDVDRTDNVDPLVGTDLAPGDSISGGLAVGIPDDGDIAQVVWLVGQGMLPILVNNLDPVALGDQVTLYNTDYAEEAAITTEDVVDNFDDLAKGTEPQKGLKFVGVTVTFENTGEEAFTPVPASVFLGTTDGIFWAPESSVDRSADAIDQTPDLTDDPIDPGDSVTGFVGFQIPQDLEIAWVMYLPDTSRLIRIYDADAGESGTPTADDTGKNDGGLGPIGKQTPTPSSGSKKTPEATGNECAGAADWQDVTLETLRGLGRCLPEPRSLYARRRSRERRPGRRRHDPRPGRPSSATATRRRLRKTSTICSSRPMRIPPRRSTTSPMPSTPATPPPTRTPSRPSATSATASPRATSPIPSPSSSPPAPKSTSSRNTQPARLDPGVRATGPEVRVFGCSGFLGVRGSERYWLLD